MIATIIVGNGIGMALDSNYFQLSTSLQNTWDSFSSDEQRIISLGTVKMPSSEDELERHHLVMTACKELSTHENNSLQWLTDEGKMFPDLYQNFIYKAAKHFFEYNKCLPEPFIESICNFIKSINRCHIATLNYDKLLYDPFIQRSILSGYQSQGLVDGIHNLGLGFQPENLLRTHSDFGWYLHLHGSPVFRTTGEIINKCNLNSLPLHAFDNNTVHNHIVLAKTELKPEIISNSPILAIYFAFFTRALSESDALYIIGYNGLDKHVNFEIKQWFSTGIKKNFNPKIHIVEWNKSDHDLDFWYQKFLPIEMNSYRSNNITLEPLDNILDYKFQS